MSLVTVVGTYKDGRIELKEQPSDVQEGTPVFVTFLPVNGAVSLTEGPSVASDEEREALRQEAFRQMEEGIHLGEGRPYRNREELYDRLNRFK